MTWSRNGLPPTPDTCPSCRKPLTAIRIKKGMFVPSAGGQKERSVCQTAGCPQQHRPT